ncbi:hypothetical protein D782_2796 [Enterobacteriaceae bacterium strain FGI 57]|nr:hypothetical protein D782_2796 [Enterobacteriaceae bacterium strain FGI 57]
MVNIFFSMLFVDDLQYKVSLFLVSEVYYGYV